MAKKLPDNGGTGSLPDRGGQNVDAKALREKAIAAPDNSKKKLTVKPDPSKPNSGKSRPTIQEQAQADLDAKLKSEKKARKWKSEIELAGKREDGWRKDSEEIIDKYRGVNVRKNGFNILWANTEILRPAIYNSTPKPDVRRRFSDADPVGKAVGEILERALYVVTDHYATDCAFKLDALDSLLPGRGLSRVRYLAKIDKVPHQIGTPDPEDDDALEPQYDERVAYEQCLTEHVDWKDFRHGFGRQWEEVTWVGFRCKLTYEEADDKFGKDAIEKIKFTVPQLEDSKRNDVATEVEKQAEFWEIWDKNSRTVFFTNTDLPSCLFPLDNPNGEPPIDFECFFPCAEPLKIIENTGSLIPIPIYTLYKQQADELDRISMRIIKLVDSLRLRGAYDSSLPEMDQIMAAGDNLMVPISKAAAWRDNGGLDKAITWLPIGPAAQVLEQLTMARESAKQVIYEITGISDIVRGASVASETATAQQIKANYASARLKKMQAEVQRYTRDTLRLCAEVIAEKFGRDTLSKMTGLQYPTAEQQQQAQQMQAMHAAAAQQMGQPPPPPDPQAQEMLSSVNWEQIETVLHSDGLRDFKIDVETDSTVAASIESDMDSLSKVLQSVGQAFQIFGPLVQEGVMPLDAAKQIVLQVCRRAKMGLAVEDSIEAMAQPPPKQPEPPPPDSSPQVAQIKAQSDQQIAQLTAQSDQQREQMKNQLQAQINGQELQFKAAMDERQKAHDQQMAALTTQAENLRAATQLETQRQIADALNATNLRIAELGNQHKADMQAQQQTHEQTMASINAENDRKLATMAPASSDAPKAADYRAIESDGGKTVTNHV